MDDEDKKKQELEELLALLENIKGSHTELVTVLIPFGTNICLLYTSPSPRD